MKIPERIWASGWDRDPTGHWWHDTELRGHPEYIRRDPTVLAELPEVRESLRAREEAAVRRALEGAAKCCDAELGNTAMLLSNPPKSSAAWDAANAIRALADNPSQFIGG